MRQRTRRGRCRNNPARVQREGDGADNNLALPLWQLVRASTAAPHASRRNRSRLASNLFVFVDGGVTMYNNPAFQLFLMATVRRTACAGQRVKTRCSSCSIGTGTSPKANAPRARRDEPPLQRDIDPVSADVRRRQRAGLPVPHLRQDALRRSARSGNRGFDSGRRIRCRGRIPGPVQPKLFTYVRYNAELTGAGLTALGLPRMVPEHVQEMDSVDHIQELQQVGRAVAEKKVNRSTLRWISRLDPQLA